MIVKLMRAFLSVVICISIAASIYVYFATTKANKVAEEASPLIVEGNAAVTDMGTANDEMFGEEPLKAFPQDRAKFESSAAKVIACLTKAAEKYRAAAAKYDEGATASGTNSLKTYLATRAKAFNKLAESKEAFRQIAAAFLDPSVTSASQFKEKRDTFTAQGIPLNKEFEDLIAAADAIVKANPSDFEVKGEEKPK
jgi:hypothetical protein